MKKITVSKSDRSLPREGGGKIFFPFLFYLPFLLLISCHEEVKLSREELARRDSAALHVALMPVEDCFPFYLAQRTGIYERLGLDLRIHTYQAQLDTDTALARGHVHVSYSDLARAMMLQQDSVGLRAIATFEGRLDLISTHRGRVRKLEQLKERMLAVARHSITDYWSDRLTDTASLARTDIFRPQINDVRIRTDMLCNGTMDAAFLPEPYATEASLRGNRRNFSTRDLRPQLVALLVSKNCLNDDSRREQVNLLMKGYDQAVAQYALEPALRDSMPSLLSTLCLTPDTLVDSLITRLPSFTPLSRPRQTDADAALQWLRGRGKVKKNYTADSLIYDLYGN